MEIFWGSVGMNGSVDWACVEQQQGVAGVPAGLPPKASGVSCSSLPATLVDGECSAASGPPSLPTDGSVVPREISRSSPPPNSFTPKESCGGVVSGPQTSKKYFEPRESCGGVVSGPQTSKKYVEPHWPDQVVEEAIEVRFFFGCKERNYPNKDLYKDWIVIADLLSSYICRKAVPSKQNSV